MKFYELRKAVSELEDCGKRDKIVKTYALEILDHYKDLFQRDDDYNINHENVKWLLCGAENWYRYSVGGCSLVYDGDIEERIGMGGDLIERQADYLRQAYNMIANIATLDEPDYNWLPIVVMI